MTENGSDRYAILTVREYENSVAMPEDKRVTYTDPRGGVHLKDGDERAADYRALAERCAEYLRFGYEVDDVTCGDYPRQEALKICNTPRLYMEAGFQQLPVLYTQKHLLKSLRPKNEEDPHCHGLTIEQVKRLPELLENPVMLCDSPARDDVMLSVLCEVDCDELPLIAAVRPDGRGHYEMREMETNFILTVYGKNNFQKYFDDLITPDKVIYFNKERGRELDALAKLHLLRSHVAEPDLYDKIIRRPQCIVKMIAAGQSGYSLGSEARDARAASGELGKGGTDNRAHDREER